MKTLTAKPKKINTLILSELSKKRKVILPLNQIICGDVIEELKKIPSESIDLIIADPPYWKVINEKWDYQWRLESDYIGWSNQWFEQVYRVLRKGGSFYVFGYFRMLALLLDGLLQLGFDLRQQIIIDKGMRSVSGRATKNYKMFPNVTESILFLTKDSKPFIKKFLKERQQEKGYSAKEINELLGVKSNGGGMWSIYTGENVCEQTPTRELWRKLSEVLDFDLPYEEVAMIFNAQMGLTDVWRDINFYKEKRYHPTQKPVNLIERLIKASSNEGMVILDPFLGAGSTALAAKRLKRSYIGIDIDKNFCETARKRLKEENFENQKKLF
jgi:DNA modification methylase